MKPKFNVGDVCEVVCKHNGHDEGSEVRSDFKIKKVISGGGDSRNEFVYFPKDGKRGAFESQLRLQYVNWRKRIEK